MDDTSSLTRHNTTHVRTMFHGVRREYHAAAHYWHERCAPNELYLDHEARERPFPAPGIILSEREDCVCSDLLVIMDYNLEGGTYHSTMNYVYAARAHGLSVALLNWRRYDLDVTKPLNPMLRLLAHEGTLRIVSPGETIRTSTVVLGYPTLLRHVIDSCPNIAHENFLVVVNQMAARLISGDDVQYDPLKVRANIKDLFGTEGLWAPISGLVRELMEADPRYPTPHQDTWTPLIDTQTWCSYPLRWRGRRRSRPKLGRHGRDHYTKWPADANALRAAYCADRPCEVSILGGAAFAGEIIGEIPSNWTVHAFGALDSRTFLSDLDFFVHYCHEDYIEEFGRAPMEAMAIGIPVILPPVFRKTFGEAALYAEPDEVWPTVEQLWSSEDTYLAHAEAGRQFVLSHCGWEQLPARLKRLPKEVGF